MSELGSGTAVAIQSVEWLDGGSGRLTVRVTGRWRRRRTWGAAEARTPAVLVVEAEGHRHRFPALPDPPSLGGAAPGSWRLTFSVPGELAPSLGGHAYLTLGTVTVPLPVAGGAEGPAVVESPAPPVEVDAAPAGAEDRVAELERALAQARDDHARALDDGDRRRRDAEQRAHAEEALRHDLERRLRDRPRSASPLRDAPAVVDPERARLAAEVALRGHRSPRRHAPAEPPVPVDRIRALASTGPAGPELSASEPEVVAALRRELGARASAEAGLRARLVQAETRLAARVLLEQRTTATLRELRAELRSLGDALAAERAARAAAEAEAGRLRSELGGRREHVHDVADAIGEIRGALEGLRRPVAPEAAEADAPGRSASADDAAPPATVTPERLSDALARLRDSQPPREGAPPAAEPPAAEPTPVSSTRSVGGPTVGGALRRLLGRDAGQAGRVLLGLVGAQGIAYPHPVSYDLVLGVGHGCVQVTVDAKAAAPGCGAARVVVSGAARAREQVDLQVVGDPARVARLMLGSGLRRLLRIGVARVRGSRAGLAAPRALLGLPLDLPGLVDAGAQLTPEALLALAGAMIDPDWTRGERFVLSCAEVGGPPAYLELRDGRAPIVTVMPPAARAVVSLVGAPAALARSLAAESGEVAVAGDVDALGLVRGWIQRAQSG